MEWINFYVTDVVRHVSTAQLLAVTAYIGSTCTGFVAVDEGRRDFDYTDQEDGPDVPLEVFFLKKRDVTKIKASKDKAALIAELNNKIIRSNVSAVGLLLYKIDELAMDTLPLDRAGLSAKVDTEAVRAAGREVQDLAEIKRLGDMAKKLLSNAEEIDAQVLRRFVLRRPQGAELAAQVQK